MMKINLLLSFLACCMLVSGGNTVRNDQTLSKSQSKTYADFLNDVTVTIQYGNDPARLDIIENLSDKIYDFYLPLRKYLVSKSHSHTYNDVVKDTLDEKNDNDTYGNKDGDKEPVALYRILDSIGKAGASKNVTPTCISDIGRLITSLLSREPWAIQFFDASGKPGPSLTQFHFNFVGNYDQCRAAAAPPDAVEKRKGFQGNYCPIILQTSEAFVKPQLGACLPDSCSSAEISLLMQEIFMGSTFFGLPLKAVYSDCLTAPKEMTAGTVAAITILSIIGIMMIIGTAMDVFIVKSWKESGDELNGQSNVSNLDINNIINNGYESVDESINEINRGISRLNVPDEASPLLYGPPVPKPSTTIDGTSYRNNQSLALKIFLAFSVYSNGKKLLSTKQAPGSLGAVHGIRFLSMSWVVLCHWYGFCISFMLNGLNEFPHLFNRWTFLPIANGFVSVDSFFTLSGLLTSYLTIKEMKRKKSSNINWLKFFFHRFWRLTPPYMFALVIVLGLNQYLGQGPLWSNLQPADKMACEKNWWTNLLYVNNLVRPTEGCFGHSWYLANDMQFFVISPLLLIPFYFKTLYGLISCLVVLLASLITTGVLSTVHSWPTTTTSLHPAPGRASQQEWFLHYYIVPWCRIGPFVVGIIAGYILALTKGRPFRMPWWIVVPGWLISVGSGLAVVYGIRGDITGDNPSTVEAAAFYNAVSRSVWGACVSWVIIACSAGYGGPVNALLSWSPFIVLGRLTYMTYLIHLCIGGTFLQNLGALLYFNDTTMITLYLGVLMVVNMISFVLVLALESPMLGLEKVFIPRGRRH